MLIASSMVGQTLTATRTGESNIAFGFLDAPSRVNDYGSADSLLNREMIYVVWTIPPCWNRGEVSSPVATHLPSIFRHSGNSSGRNRGQNEGGGRSRSSGRERGGVPSGCDRVWQPTGRGSDRGRDALRDGRETSRILLLAVLPPDPRPPISEARCPQAGPISLTKARWLTPSC